MHFLVRWKTQRAQEKRRLNRIAVLDKIDTEAFQSVFDLPSDASEDDRDIAYSIYRAEAGFANEERTQLLQVPLYRALKKAGIDIPDECWEDREEGDRWPRFNSRGEERLRIELRKYRDSRIEFWFKLVLPVLSTIISLIALFKKSR